MEVHKSKCLSNVRIHVERVIGNMRSYFILQSTIPVNQVRLLDDIVVIIAALTNILPNRNYSAILATLKINCFLPRVNDGILNVTPCAANSSDTKNPRSAKTSSPWDSLYIYPDFRVISL
jgi:hypothetical protein